MNTLAQRTGITVGALQALQMAAKLSGVDDATGALQKLTVAIGTAAESGKTEAFTKLGLDFQALQSMAPEEQFKAVQSAIAGLATPAERAAAAVSLFGKSGVELLPLLAGLFPQLQTAFVFGTNVRAVQALLLLFTLGMGFTSASAGSATTQLVPVLAWILGITVLAEPVVETAELRMSSTEKMKPGKPSAVVSVSGRPGPTVTSTCHCALRPSASGATGVSRGTTSG
jgi:hypothetical protein